MAVAIVSPSETSANQFCRPITVQTWDGSETTQPAADAFCVKARELDEIENVVWLRSDLPLDRAVELVEQVETELYRERSTSLAAFEWRLARLERAFENGWSLDAARPLLESLAADIRDLI